MGDQEKFESVLPIKSPQPEESIGEQVPPYVSTHWYLTISKPLDPHVYTISSLFETSLRLDETFLQRTIEHLQEHHDILRSRFVQKDGIWQHFILASDEAKSTIMRVDLASLAGKVQQTQAMEAIVRDIQFTINLTNGPVFRVVYIDLGSDKNGWLVFVVHHMLADGFSLRIFTEDFVRTYMQVSQSQPVSLPRKTNSFKQWSTYLNEYVQLPERQQEVDYLLHLPWDKVRPLPLDYPFQRDKNIFSSMEEVKVFLSSTDTDRLIKCSRKARISLLDVLVTALVQSLAKWTESPLVHLGIVNNARLLFPDLNISRTMGFFALFQDVLLEACPTCTFLEALQLVKKQRSTMPFNGFSRDILAFIGQDKTVSQQLQSLPQRQITFNYLGGIFQQTPPSSFLHLAEEEITQSKGSQNVRPEIVHIECKIVQKQLYFSLEYSRNLHKRTTVEMYGHYLLEALQYFIVDQSSTEQQ